MLQTLNVALENVPKDRNGKLCKEHLRMGLDNLAPSAGLPPLGAVEQVRTLISLLSHHLRTPIIYLLKKKKKKQRAYTKQLW